LGKSWLAVNSVYRIYPGAKFPAFTPLLQIIGQIPVIERSFQALGNAIKRGGEYFIDTYRPTDQRLSTPLPCISENTELVRNAGWYAVQLASGFEQINCKK
jgi:hypothetical protein